LPKKKEKEEKRKKKENKKLDYVFMFIFVYMLVYNTWCTGANPLFGGLKSSKSVLGKTKSVWVEGEGMLHALYFKRKNDGSYTIFYNNRYVQTATYNLEKQSTNPLFLPAVKGDSLAVMCSMLLNWVRIFYHIFKI